jgi:hypothetical protein
MKSVVIEMGYHIAKTKLPLARKHYHHELVAVTDTARLDIVPYPKTLKTWVP